MKVREERRKLDDRVYGVETAVETGIAETGNMMEIMMQSRILTTTAAHVPVTAIGSANQPGPEDNSKGASGGESHSTVSRATAAPTSFPTSRLNVFE